MIKMWDTAEQFQDQQQEILTAIEKIGYSGQYYDHEEIWNFENTIKKQYGFHYVLSCNSGTNALTLSLQNIRKDIKKLPDENFWVVMPAMTYIATANAINNAGMTPYIIDIDDHWMMDYDKLVETLEEFGDIISAVVIVDLYGQTARLPQYYHLCKNYNIPLIVDAAQSYGIKTHGWDQADYSDYITFSMNPLKNWGAMGNAGAIGTKANNLSEQRCQAHQGKFGQDAIHNGGNYRMDALQAAVLNVKHKLFNERVERKRAISHYYRDRLKNYVEMPEWAGWCTHMHYVFPFATNRSLEVKQKLIDNKIEFGSHYHRAVNDYTPYFDFNITLKARSMRGRIITIPNHAHLSDSDVERVITSVISAL